MRKALALLVASASISVLAACGGSHDGSAAIPKTLVGNWYQTNPTQTGVDMRAEITPNAIQIDIISRDDTFKYWLGTFETNKSTSAPFTTVSLADQDALAKSFLGARGSTKKFDYNNGVISFKFERVGVTTTVHLAKLPDAHSAKPAKTASIAVPPKIVKPTRAAVPRRTTKIITPPKPVSPPKLSLKK